MGRKKSSGDVSLLVLVAVEPLDQTERQAAVVERRALGFLVEGFDVIGGREPLGRSSTISSR
jgi:hypothetical protein